MRDYRDIAEDIFERREQYAAGQKRSRRTLARAAVSMCCMCLAALLGFGVWRSRIFGIAPSGTQEAPVNIGTDAANGNAQEKFK